MGGGQLDAHLLNAQAHVIQSTRCFRSVGRQPDSMPTLIHSPVRYGPRSFVVFVLVSATANDASIMDPSLKVQFWTAVDLQRICQGDLVVDGKRCSTFRRTRAHLTKKLIWTG